MMQNGSTALVAANHAMDTAVAPAVSLSSNTLREFLDDCLDAEVGASLALERIASDNIAALEQLARYSVECEERLQTGCLMVQALTLVRYWMLLSKQTTLSEKPIVEWLCQWYSKQSDAIDDSNKRSGGSRMISWRASFAVKLYKAMGSEHFAPLLSATVAVRISTLRVLQMRFWQDDDIPLFTSILQFVSRHNIAKRLIESAILGWTRVDSADLSASSLVEEFAARIKTHLAAEATQKSLREAENVMAASEFRALQQLQHVYPQSATPLPATVVVSSTHHVLFPSMPFYSSSRPTAAFETTAMQMAPDFPPPVTVAPPPPPQPPVMAAPPPPPQPHSPPRTRRSTVHDAPPAPSSTAIEIDEVCEPSPPRRAREQAKASTPQRVSRKRSRAESEESSNAQSSDPESAIVEPVRKARQPPPKQRVDRSEQQDTSETTSEAPSSALEEPSSTSSDSITSSSSDRAATQTIRPIAFARPLGEALPFEPVVAAHLKEHGIAIVQPCFREHTAWLNELNYDLLQHSSFRYAYRMTLSCVNDGSERTVDSPNPPSLPGGIYPSSPSAEEVFAFLEEEWAHMQDPSRKRATMPKPPAAATDCVYLKDLSVVHQLRDPAKSFFSTWDKQLSDEQDRHDTLTAAASLCSVQAPTVVAASYPALYLDAYADHPASLLGLTSDRCDGVHNAYAYLKFGFQFFNLHIEQCLLPFVHHQLSGESTWILIPHREQHKLHRVVQRMARVRRSGTIDENVLHATVAPVFLYSKSLLPPPSLLKQYDVQFHQVRLSAGQVLVAHGGFAHYGFSTSAGETHALACNIMSEDWLVSGGPEFLVQFFEWVLDLSSLSPKSVSRELEACGLQAHHLANALNTCPQTYSCSLVSAIRSDLRLHENVVQQGNEYKGLFPRIRYSLHREQIRKALLTLETALDLLHHPDVRAFLKRVYVADSQTDLCKCQFGASTSPASLPERSLKRLYAAMEREHALVVGSGDSGSSNGISRVGRTRQATAAELGESGHHEKQEMPISQAFGSATIAPVSRLLDFLCSKEVTPPSLRLSPRSRFLDIGSGIGQVVLHVQLRYALASAIGIEYVPDRYAASEKTLKALKEAIGIDEPTLSGRTSPYDLASLHPALDDRMERVRFVSGRVEDHLHLLADATHVFMFDAAFDKYTHGILLPLLCTGPSRIVITCLSPDRMRRAWPRANSAIDQPPSSAEISRLYRQLNQLTLTMAGSNSTREVYIYATRSQ